MTYQVPEHIGKDKVFLINFSTLEERLDPSIYKPRFRFISKSYKNVRLPEIAWIDPLCIFDKSKEVSFIPMDAIDSTNGIVTHTGTKRVEETKGFTRFKEGDILWAKITPCMQNGKSAIARNLLNGYGCGSTEFFVIRSKDENVVKQEYLLFLLRNEKILKAAMNFFGGSAGQQRVSPLFLQTFNVPIPSIEEQRHFCELLNQAQNAKIKKEQEAEDLLRSIDDYLLGELEIQLPEMKSQTLQDRMFVLNFSEVRGDRLDAEYNNPFKHGAITKVFKMTQYPTALLSSLAKDIFQGVGKNETDDTTYILLKVKNILRGNMIDFSDVEYVKSVPQNKLLLRNDIISPFIGEAIRQIKFSIFNKEEHKYTVDNNTGVIRLKESVNAQYVCEYLCSCLGKMQIERLIGGGGVPFIGTSGAKKLSVIIPPLQKQQEIVDYISAIRQKAKSLQEEGKAILEHAKKEVEQMILGY